MKKWTRREILPLIGASLAGGVLFAAESNPIASDSKKLIDLAKYNRPKRLSKGDVIGICAPAGALRRTEEIAEFRQTLKDLGFQVKVGQHITNKHGCFAGTDQERADDFMQMIKDPEVRGIFFLRGGWGCARILPLLDFDLIRDNPKLIMGFSDATSLLNAILERSQLITFHGPSGNSSWNDYSIEYFQKATMNPSSIIMENAPGDQEIITYSSGVCSGTLWGGNLSVIVSMIGTPYFPRVEKGILFLEEVGEEPYRIDRMLTQLRQAGIFDRCNGVILGSFRKCIAEEPERAFTLEEVFTQHFKNLGKPVFYGAQIGHTMNKFTIPVGSNARVDADNGSIQTLNSAVL